LAIPVSHFEEFDIGHVREKFPHAEEFLIGRLGKANSKRRQILRYNEKHHEKIIGHHDSSLSETPQLKAGLATATGDDIWGDPGNIGDIAPVEEMNAPGNHPVSVKGAGTVVTAATQETKTIISLFQPKRGGGMPSTTSDNPDEGSETDQSQATSCASSSSPSNAYYPRVPPPPDQESALDGDPFQCPFCFTIITVSGREAWKY
jgi:hypothetical protein